MNHGVPTGFTFNLAEFGGMNLNISIIKLNRFHSIWNSLNRIWHDLA